MPPIGITDHLAALTHAARRETQYRQVLRQLASIPHNPADSSVLRQFADIVTVNAHAPTLALIERMYGQEITAEAEQVSKPNAHGMANHVVIQKILARAERTTYDQTHPHQYLSRHS